MQGGISIRGPLIPTTNVTNYSRAFECHPNANNYGTLLLSFASVGVAANTFLASLIMTRRSLRRWSSGLLLHGTIVDGTRAALLIPLALSVLKCYPVTRCSLVDTAFLLLATVTSLNLLTASLSDAPLLPPPVLVPTLLQSAGYVRSASTNRYTSPMYPKGDHGSYFSDYYEEDANLLAETTAMPDSPQCVLFGTFMVWFAALTINLGPTFLSGALAAQAEAMPRTPSCPLVRGPARHVILNALWASVNLLCVGLAATHLRKLKKDLARARLGLLAAAGAGLAGLTGIRPPGYTHTPAVSTCSASNTNHTANDNTQPQTSASMSEYHMQTMATSGEVDTFLRQAQRNGRCHIRTLGTLAAVNLLCWFPLYVCSLIAPVGTGVWEDPAPYAYEITLMAAFAHSSAHPIILLALHQPLHNALKLCMRKWCCIFCTFCGMDMDGNSEENSPQHSRAELRANIDIERKNSGVNSHHGSHSRLHCSEPIILKRSSSLKSSRSIDDSSLTPHEELTLPPPPPPVLASSFRHEVLFHGCDFNN